jgi:hypothetical protein
MKSRPATLGQTLTRQQTRRTRFHLIAFHFVADPPMSTRFRFVRSGVRCRRLLAAVALLCAFQTGCINTLVMVGKVLLGDPKQPSPFEMATGISLPKEDKQVLVHCTAPGLITTEHGTLTVDVQEGVLRRLKRHGIPVLSPDAAANVLDRSGGQFDPKLLVRELPEADYIIHVDFTRFTYMEDSSPNLYRGQADGTVVVYAARGEKNNRHVVKIYQQDFKTIYPPTHPVPVDQTPKNVFIRRFVKHNASSLGAIFYDLRPSEKFEM